MFQEVREKIDVESIFFIGILTGVIGAVLLLIAVAASGFKRDLGDGVITSALGLAGLFLLFFCFTLAF